MELALVCAPIEDTVELDVQELLVIVVVRANHTRDVIGDSWSAERRLNRERSQFPLLREARVHVIRDVGLLCGLELEL